MFDVSDSLMPDRAKVTSLEAIESFRAKLIIYRDKAGRVLDEVSDEVTRTRLWLEQDRIAHWQNQIRTRHRELEQRQQELFTAQLSGLLQASQVQQAAVQKARQALRDAEARLQVVKQWIRQYDQRVEPLGRQVEKFRHTLGTDLGRAVAWMNELLKTLSDYVELSHQGAAKPVASTTEDTATTAESPEKGGPA
jgi:DNA repair exonuclease SbcCD ATPase subunit